MHTVILGNGVAGVSAALALRERAPERRITLLSGESTHHYSRPALMYVFMGQLRYEDTKPFEDGFWREQRLELVRDWVTRVDPHERELVLRRGGRLRFDQLLLATGSRPNRLGVPGEDLAGVQGLYGLPDLVQLRANVERARRAVIVGGGLIGVELAEMLHARGLHVTMLVREPSYWLGALPPEESALVTREIVSHGVEVLTSTELAEVLDDGAGRCRGVRTRDGRELPCEVVGLTVGVSPNLAALEGSGIECDRGVLVDDHLRTNVEGILAAGDCAELPFHGTRRGIVQQVWYTGKQQGDFAGRVLAGEETGPYRLPSWFNSARFFDLEYHTYGYGQVGPELPDQRSVYWQHASGRHSVRILYTPAGVAGFTTLGQRWRHEVCERWLREARSLEYVVAHLEEAHFEPEFHRRHEPELRRAFAAAR